MSRGFRRVVCLGVFGACLAGLTAPGAAYAPRGEFAAGSPAESESKDHAFVFKIVNFLILVGGLGYVLRKPLAQFFSDRSAGIQKRLEEGRKALEASQAELQAVEERVRYLQDEIAALKAAATREIEAEGQRLRQAAGEEAERIFQSARTRLAAAVRAAKLELQDFAGQQAVERAGELIRQRLDDPSRERLVSQFMAGLGAKERSN